MSVKSKNKQKKQQLPLPKKAEINNLVTLMIVTVLSFVLYGKTINFDFTGFDDKKIIVEQNEEISGLDKIPHSFSRGFGNYYRPILRISWIIDDSFTGTSPGLYHASNIIIHIFSTWVLFILLTRFIDDKKIGLLLALLFCAHPVLVQAVAWIPGRNDSLLALFVFLSFISFDKLIKDSKPVNIILHAMAFFLAMFTKETAALFPLLALVYYFIKNDKYNYKPLIVSSVIWILIIALWFVLRQNALSGIESSDIIGFSAFKENIIMLPVMAGKALLPFKLSVMSDFDSLNMVFGLVLFAGMAAAIVVTKDLNRKLAIFGVLWFFIFIIPGLFARMENAADYFSFLEHRIYLPLAGLIIIAAALIRQINPSAKPLNLLLIFITLVFSILNISYSNSFSDRLTFWKSAEISLPEKANIKEVLGKIYHEQKNNNEAQKYFEQAIELAGRDYDEFYNNLAVVLKENGNISRAIQMSEKSVELAPQNSSYMHFLGKMLMDVKQNSKAEKYLTKAGKLDPENIDVRIFLIGIYSQENRTDEIIKACNEIIGIDPNHFHANNILASMYAAKGETDKAAHVWEKTAQLKPGYIPAYIELIKYYAKKKDKTKVDEFINKMNQYGAEIPNEIKALLINLK